jgi:uncharacterized protein (DUF885 family)/putative intracellular protease/amidase
MTRLHKHIILALTLTLLGLWAAGCQTKQPTAEPTAAPTIQPEPTKQPAAAPAEPPAPEPTQAEPAPTQPPPAEPAPTTPPVPEPAATEKPITSSATSDLSARLEGLSLEEFFEASWREVMLRYPETIVEEGLSEFYVLESAQLTDISDAYTRETYQVYATILEMLRTYDRDALTPKQQISYDVYEWYLDDKVREQEFMYYDYPATYYPITAVHETLTQFFTDLHPLANKQDAQDYVTRLGLVDTKFEQLLEGLELREAAGIVPPKFAIQWAMSSVQEMARSSATHTPFYQTLADKLEGLDDVDEAEKQALLDSAQEAINQAVLPAFQELADYLAHLQSVAPSDDGVWQFPNGDAYYAYVLRHRTTTAMTADEIHELGKKELERIHTEMRAIFDELGYPQDESLPQLFDRVEKDGGHVSGNQVLETYTDLIEQAKQNLDPAFDVRPHAQVVVIGDSFGGFYVSGSYDGSRPGAFYANVSGAGENYYSMPTLAYHEAIPGHHFQISLAQEADLPSFRRGIFFTAYAEGWALYAERLAWELGWYDDDPYGNLGRLQAEAFRAARLVIDTGIHAQGWTFEEASAFMTENVGFEPGDSVHPDYEVARYIVWPGQSTSYMIGLIKMLELRQKAMERLGDQFDLKEFHDVILLNGGMPLEILERVVDGYIEDKLNPSAQAPPSSEPGQSTGRVVVIFGDRFIPEIYDIVPPALAEAGYEVVVASNTLSAIHAKDADIEVEPDMLLKDVQVQDYDAIIFNCDNDISFGGGRPETDRIAQEAVAQEKVLAAICAAPMVLGYAGVVEGINVTGEPSNTCRALERTYGATCTNKDVEQHGLIITAKSRWSSSGFAQAIVQTLQEQ